MHVSNEMKRDIKKRLRYPIHFAKALRLYEGPVRRQKGGCWADCCFCGSKGTLSVRLYVKPDEASIMGICQSCRCKKDVLAIVGKVFRVHRLWEQYQAAVRVALWIENYLGGSV